MNRWVARTELPPGQPVRPMHARGYHQEPDYGQQFHGRASKRGAAAQHTCCANRAQQCQRSNGRQRVSGQLGLRKAEEENRENRPAGKEEPGGVGPRPVAPEPYSLLCNRPEQNCPWKQRNQNDRAEIPERLAVLKQRRCVSLYIVLPQKNMQKIRVANRAQDVPGKRDDCKRSNRQGMSQAKCLTPLPGRKRP